MATPDTLRDTRIPLNNGSGAIPAVGFGTLIHDPLATKESTKTALEVGFRHFDCAERYRNEEAVGDAMQAAFSAGTIRREDVFVSTKLWNTNHRPERVKPAFDASRRRLQIDDVDCYLIHTPFAFRPGDELDPRDEHGQVIYDSGVTLADTWRALEGLVDDGQCKSIGVTDVADHAGPLEPRGIDLATAIKHPQGRRTAGRCVQRVKHEVREEAGHVHDIAVELLKRLGDVEGQLFQARQEGVGLLRAKPRPRDRLPRRV